MKPLYFDYAATTPCADEVLMAMMPYWQNDFGNPNSRSHVYGWEAEEAMQLARGRIAAAIGADADEIVFTSGATESNNLAIKGAMQFAKKKKIVSTIVEHKCVIEVLRRLEIEGVEIVLLPVDENGLINLDELEQHVTDAGLVSIAYVNNETGVVQNMHVISEICAKAGVYLHTDAAQALGKVLIDARRFSLISLSAHKIYGPKGVGALFVSKNPRVRVNALFNGGGQERGMRSGTQPVPLCVGFGVAAELAMKRMHIDATQAVKFQDFLLKELEVVDNIKLNGTLQSKVPHIVNISAAYIEGESLIMKLAEFAVASGSACTSRSLEPSHVITAMNKNSDYSHSSLRICFGRQTQFHEVQALSKALIKGVLELREISPLWDMFKSGMDLSKINWGS